VFIHAEAGAVLEVDVATTHGPADFGYLFDPSGRTIVRRRFAPGFSGTLTQPLSAGTHVLVPSPSHRMDIRVWNGSLALEPETEFPTWHTSGTAAVEFVVPEETSAFTVHATTQHGWQTRAGRVRVLDPDGTERVRLEFDTLDQDGILAALGLTPDRIAFYRSQGDTAVVPEFRLLIETADVVAPPAGRWTIETTVEGIGDDDIGVWLSGIPNRLYPPGGPAFIDERRNAAATVEVFPERDKGRRGDVGTVWGFTVESERSRAVFRELGLTASKHFFPQVDMEPENDNADPLVARDDAFLFSTFRDRLDPYRDPSFPLTALMAVTRPAPYAMTSKDEIAEFVSAAVAYHHRTLGLDPGGLYWQFLNEPNHYVSEAEYVEAFRAIGRRLERDLGDETDVQWGGPALGNATGERNAVEWSWIESLLREADEELDFVVWNQYWLPRLEDTWRFGAHIAHADSLIEVLDTDGQTEEILIGATNLRGGIVLETSKQDGAFSALWWPSVLCHTLGTGRVRLVNYFFLIDQGARRKGLLRSDWSRKPVADATAFVTGHAATRVVAAMTDHDALDVLATRDPEGGTLHLILVNRHDRPLDVTCRVPRAAPVGAEIMNPVTSVRTPLVMRMSTDDVLAEIPARSLAAIVFEVAP
jgi:hypothetical protein